MFDGEGFVERDVFIDGGVFAAAADDAEVIDATGCYVIPGLVDLHFHGSAGGDISDGAATLFLREMALTICDAT